MTGWLNYNHLYYFWMIAREGGISDAARKLRLSASALSIQLQKLEESLGRPLFERKGRSLELNENGRVALEYANHIFQTGEEFLQVIQTETPEERKRVLRVGALGGMSKNLQYDILERFLRNPNVDLVVVQGYAVDLLRQLKEHLLDVVISNINVSGDAHRKVFHHRLKDVPVVAVGTSRYVPLRKKFPEYLGTVPLFVPTHQSQVRTDFDAFLARNEIKAHFKAEVEATPLLRLFALSGDGIAVVPEVAVERDIADGTLKVLNRIPEVKETVYALTVERRIRNPLLVDIIKHASR